MYELIQNTTQQKELKKWISNDTEPQQTVQANEDIFNAEDITKEPSQDPIYTTAIQELDLSMEDDCEDGIDMEAILAKVKQQLKKKEAPPPRASADIQVTFTDRGAIPTSVARESEDIKWRARIAQMTAEYNRKNAKAVEEDTKHYTDWMWKDKAEEWYKQGNLESAVNAYSQALALNPSMIE